MVVLAVLVATGACASGDQDPRQAYVDALATAFTSGNGGPPLDEEVARCAAGALVDVVGVEALRRADVSGQELADAADLRSLEVQVPSDAAATLATDFDACDLGPAVEGPLLDAFAAESGAALSDPARSCVADQASDAAIEAGLAATFVDEANGDPGFDEILAGVGACPAAMIELLHNGFEQAGGPLSDTAAACLAQHVEGHPEQAAATFAEGGAAADAYAAQLLADCPTIAR